MTATVESDNFTVFTYENLLVHASPSIGSSCEVISLSKEVLFLNPMARV
jgi:hypothetical protein